MKAQILAIISSSLVTSAAQAEYIPPDVQAEMQKLRADQIRRSIAALASSKDKERRRRAARTLEQTRNPHDGVAHRYNGAEIAALLKAIQKELDLSTKLLALSSLSNVFHFGPGAPILKFLNRLERGHPGEIRSEATYQLFRCKTGDDPRSYKVFRTVAYANVKQAFQKIVIQGHKVVERWDLDHQVLRRDADLLVPPLIRLLAGEAPVRIHGEACDVLGAMGEKAAAALPQPGRTAQRTSPVLQVHALRAMATIQPRKANKQLASALKPLLSHRYWRVRRLAVELMIRMKLGSQLPAALQKDPVLMVRQGLKKKL